ncbi:HIT family protein [Candidatus Poriferisodalis sp.]|uniref:HIT family protein n=1 Tax=Candidatus Poriferisodalis sp. TaxID=3101277 RepID=UPI003B5281C1
MQCDDSKLCDEIAGAVDGIAFHEIYAGDPPSRIIGQSDNFLLICDISPIVAGHCLLVPRHHYLAFGHIPGNLANEFETFRAECEHLVGSIFGSPTVLEHGSSSTMSPSACVTHAHCHIVPNAAASYDVFQADRLIGRRVSSWRALAEPARNDRPYIYYRDPHAGDEYLFEDNLSKRHQYLRVVTAEVFDIPEPDWDWAMKIRKHLLRETVSRLAAFS